MNETCESILQTLSPSIYRGQHGRGQYFLDHDKCTEHLDLLQGTHQ